MTTGADEKVRVWSVPDLQATACFHALPTTLTTLHLEQIDLVPAVFSAAVLPELTHLTLKQCGPETESVAASLVAACPKLTRENVKTVCAPPRR